MDMMDILKKYVDVIHPKRFGPAIATEAKRDDAKLTFLHVLLISLLGVLALVAYVSIYTRMIDDMFSGTGAAIPPEIPTLKENMLQSIAPVALILNFLGSVVSFYAINGFLFLLCRALGGNGKLGNQLYVISVIMVAVSVPYALLMLLAGGPMISCIVAPFMLVLMLYAVFLTYVALRAVHPSLGQWKAVAAILLQAAVFALVAFLLSRFFS